MSQCHRGAGGRAGIKDPVPADPETKHYSSEVMAVVERTLTLRSQLLSLNSCPATCHICDFGQDTESLHLSFSSMNTLKEGPL